MTDSIENGVYRNVNHKSDTDYVVKVARTLMKPIGIWPLAEGFSFFDRTIKFLHNSAVFILMCFLLIPHVIYTYFDAEDKSKMMDVIAAQVFSTLAVIKFLVVIINRRKIRYCLERMAEQYRDVPCKEDRSVLIKNAKIGRLFTTVYLSLCYGGAFPYHIVIPFTAEKIVKEDNSTQLPLPYPSNFLFFTVDDSPFHEIVFVSQILISNLILCSNCGIYSLIAPCVMHSCALFEVVCRRMEILLQGGISDNLYKKFGGLIQQHLDAIEYARIIEDALNIVFLSEMVGCTIIICFLEYGVLKDMEDGETLGMVTYFILMTSIFVNVFILSFIGDCLKEKSGKLADYAYFIEWYDLPPNISEDIILILLRCSQPSRLTAGKIFDLSLQGFCDVVKTSAAYLNFIRAVTA